MQTEGDKNIKEKPKQGAPGEEIGGQDGEKEAGQRWGECGITKSVVGIEDETERRINIVGEMDNITKLTVGIKGKPEGGKPEKNEMDGELWRVR